MAGIFWLFARGRLFRVNSHCLAHLISMHLSSQNYAIEHTVDRRHRALNGLMIFVSAMAAYWSSSCPSRAS